MIKFKKPAQSEYQQIVNLINDAEKPFLNLHSQKENEIIGVTNETVEDLVEGENKRDYLCVYDNDQLVGFASFRTKNIQTLWLSQLYIDPQVQQKGYGTSLLKKLEQIAKDRNLLVVVLETDVKADWAVNFYLKNDYTILNKEELKQYPFDMVLDKDPVDGRYVLGKEL